MDVMFRMMKMNLNQPYFIPTAHSSGMRVMQEQG